MAATPLLGAAAPDGCAALARLGSPALDIVEAVMVGDTCRVSAIARPRPNAAIGIELWLPPPGRWSGRYYQMGNGGFAGSIHRPTLAAAAARGDAAASTDTGHKGDAFDARWAVGRPDLVLDYAYRSTKVTADTAASLIARYYGQAARRRYFMGCSNGGRQALIAAARWPRDWDGVIAGAPATGWYDRLTSFGQIERAVHGAAGAWIGPARLAGVLQAATRVCRTGQGASCVTRALPALCRSGDRAACLTPRQSTALRVIADAGYPPAAAAAGEWGRWFYAHDRAANSTRKLGAQFAHLKGAVPPARLRDALDIGDLRPFFARNGRILSYFGWADAVLPVIPGIAAYRSLTPETSRRVHYRLFTVPGMHHCQGGRAPFAFGQALDAPALRDDRAHDIRRALEAWVEDGRPPERLIAQNPADARTAQLIPLD